jgi:hypothetical protein
MYACRMYICVAGKAAEKGPCSPCTPPVTHSRQEHHMHGLPTWLVCGKVLCCPCMSSEKVLWAELNAFRMIRIENGPTNLGRYFRLLEAIGA